jgi:hypothetical protein
VSRCLPVPTAADPQSAALLRQRLGKGLASRYVGLIIGRHVKHPVMIDQAEANAVEPAEAPEQILIDPFIGEKIHYRFEVQTKRLDGDQMTKSLDAPGGSPECHRITRLYVEAQQFGVPSFKQAVGSPGIPRGQTSAQAA